LVKTSIFDIEEKMLKLPICQKNAIVIKVLMSEGKSSKKIGKTKNYG